MTVQIGVIPDIHMRSSHSDTITSGLKQAVARFREFDPDLVVLLGDLIQDESAPQDRVHIEQVLEIFSAEWPVRSVAGNHDVANLDHEELVSLFGNDLWGVERVGGETIVFLDTSAPWLHGARGEVSEPQLELLEEKNQSGNPYTVFAHHPIHYSDLGRSHWWSTCPERAFCGNKKEINKILNPELVKTVISGHIHENHITQYTGIERISLNAFSKEARNKPYTGTYGLVEIDEEVDITVETNGELVRRYSF